MTASDWKGGRAVNRVNAYVDGFNLYFGLKAKFARKQLWLDLQSLISALLRPGQQLGEVQYFTARVRNDPDGELRQATYLDALQAYCPQVRVIEGRFQEKSRGCRNCGITWTGYEEKETDVNIALELLADAVQDKYDTAIIVSGDSDLRPAVAKVKLVRPDKRIVVAFPPQRHSADLKRIADGFVYIGADKVRQAQLPPKVLTPGGVPLLRPPYWS